MKGPWKSLARAISGGADYLDDRVRSRPISALALVGVLGPVLRWMIHIYEEHMDNPMILFVLYAVVATLGYLALLPMTLGNGLYITRTHIHDWSRWNPKLLIVISIGFCFVGVIYSIVLFTEFATDSSGKLDDNWFYQIIVTTSIAGYVGAILLYCFHLYKLFTGAKQETFVDRKRNILEPIINKYLPAFKEIQFEVDVRNTNEKDRNKNKNTKNQNNALMTPSTTTTTRASVKVSLLANEVNDINDLNADELENNFSFTEREILKGYKYSLKQFLWPTVDFDLILQDSNSEASKKVAELKEELSKVVYPARLYGAVWLALAFCLGVLYVNVLCYNWLDDTSSSISSGYDELTSATTSYASSYTSYITSAATLSLLTYIDALSDFCDSLKTGLMCGMIVGFVWGVFGCVLTFRAWRKKVVFLRLGVPTYRLNASNKGEFGVWWTTRFMGVFATYIATGTFLISWLLCVVVGLIVYDEFWSWLGGYWQYILGYVLYYALDLIVVRWLLFGKYLSDREKENSLLPGRTSLFSVLMLLSDFVFVPLAVLNGVFRVLLYNLICVVSFLRPDINIWPRGLESMDYGYLTYIASVRITVEREPKFVEKAGLMASSQSQQDLDENENFKKLGNDNGRDTGYVRIVGSLSEPGPAGHGAGEAMDAELESAPRKSTAL